MQPKAYNHAKNRLLGLFLCQNPPPPLAGSEIFNSSSLPQYKHSSNNNNNNKSSNSPQTNNANAHISRVETEESEADWDNRAMASVNIIRDNEESSFEDFEPNTAAFVSSVDGATSTGIIGAGSSTSLNSVKIANTSRPVDAVSKVRIATSMDYSGSSQQLREVQIENLNDDELINLATENRSNSNNYSINNNNSNNISNSSSSSSNNQSKLENESL